MKKTSSFIIASVVAWGVLLPTLLFAQEKVTANDITSGLKSGAGIINTLNETIVKSLAALLLSSAMLVFFAGIVQYIWGKRQGDSGKVKTGNEFITWSLVALFVMFSVYGIIRLGQSILFGTKDVNTIDIPTFNFRRGTSDAVQIGNNLSPGNGGTGGGSLSPTNGGVGGFERFNQGGLNGSGVSNSVEQRGGCPSGETYDSDTGQCLKSVLPSNTESCPSGETYDSDTGQCLKSVLTPEQQCSNTGGSLDSSGNCIMPD